MSYSTILDTHLHLIDRRALNYPWLAGAPALNQDFLLERYQAEALRCGIGAALHMEVDVAESDIEAETHQVAALAKRPGSLVIGAISACRPENADFPGFLERQLADPTVRGFRRVLHVVPDEVSLSPSFRANIARLGGTGRPFDFCVRPDQIDKAIALVDLCPNVQFVLDHCGAPKIKEREEHPWRERMREIARRPNVVVKISGVVAYADGASWTLDDIRPYVEHAIDCFGWDRVVWGSDWPVCTLTASLSIWVAASQAIVKDCSLDERGRLFRRNAERIWRLA
ncbi:MAG: amidohydrolase [Bradyrhizobium sp.]|nr:MAG: amidohydrolase [Bradyrhizobium sp.]